TEIDTFNAFFSQEAKKNDIYDIIYIPEQGVSVYIKGELKGSIKGLDFKKAAFSIWLGKKPADSKLKRKMLGE
ncbi:MAG: chalcone isomerase family protein, partial [Desulfobacterales bacterium]